MKSQLLLFMGLILMIACANDKKQTVKEPQKELLENPKKELTKTEVTSPKEIPLSTFYGHYVGDFKAVTFKEDKKPSYFNKINITIDSMIDGKAYGHSVVAGNARSFQGSYKKKDDNYLFEVVEPGDDQYDGKFQFVLLVKPLILEGEWEANDQKLAVTKRKFYLESRKFEYNPQTALPEDFVFDSLYDSYKEDSDAEESLTDDVLKFNPSLTVLKKEEVENMYQRDIEVLRNSIYARHGYSFKNRRMRYLFDRYVEWYIPLKTNILADLTDLEKKNIDLLKRYEKHAEKYYDVFGR